MDKTQAIDAIHQLLRRVRERGGSDLFLTAGFPPAIRVNGRVMRIGETPLSPEASAMMVRSLMNDKHLREFDATKECNFAIYPSGVGRFRVNAFIQHGHAGAVMRLITTDIPTLDQLELPPGLKDIAMASRGLVLVVGATGSGKSTTLAAMLHYRNLNSQGHIVTIEDPVEFMHTHGKSIVTQREIGVDTLGWGDALKNALRQSPDVLMIGEIRDRETMAYALQFSETGHLCFASLHANNANQSLGRVLNFFPQAKRQQVLMDLSMNLRAVISQRLVRRTHGQGRIASLDIMLNSPLIGDLIFKGETGRIKEVMAKSKERGMITFDQCLFELYEAGKISREEALRHADSHNELRLRIKLESRRSDPAAGGEGPQLSLVDDDREARNPGQSLRPIKR